MSPPLGKPAVTSRYMVPIATFEAKEGGARDEITAHWPKRRFDWTRIIKSGILSFFEHFVNHQPPMG